MNAVQKQDLIHQFKNLSGVEEVLPADINYLGGVSGTGMYTEKDDKGSYVDVNVMRITSGFFRFMHIPMRSGHTPRESSDLVIDEALSHRLGTDIMGNRFIILTEMPTRLKECARHLCPVCIMIVKDLYSS